MAGYRHSWGAQTQAASYSWMSPPSQVAALPQAHAGKLSHEVELRGPRVAERNRDALEPAVDEFEVMRGERLCYHVELINAPTGLAHVEGADGLAGRQPLETRDADLDHEAAAGLEMGRGVAKARHLRVLRRQVHDRVED